jgi:hypothetical protein
VSGELGQEVAQHADKFASGLISNVEASYSKFEAAIKQTLRMPISANGAARGKKPAAAAAQQRRRQPQRRTKAAAAAAQQQKGPGVSGGGVAKRRPKTVRFWG